MEKDADTLQPIMARYLEQLTEVLALNNDNLDEMTKIVSILISDYTILSNTCTRVNEQKTYLTNMMAKKTDIANALAVAIRERKQ
jgi:hypothetical protein